MDDATAERLLRGAAPADRPELEPLTALLSQVRHLGAETPQPTPALYALLRDGFVPASTAVAATSAAPARSALRRRLAAVAGLSLGLKVLTGAGVALAGVTTAAGAGALPDAVQERVADVVRTVTPFDLDPGPQAPVERPGADERPGVEGPARGEPTLPAPAPISEPPRATPAQQPAVPTPAQPQTARPAAPNAPQERPAPAPAPQGRPDGSAPPQRGDAPAEGNGGPDRSASPAGSNQRTAPDAEPPGEAPVDGRPESTPAGSR